MKQFTYELSVSDIKTILATLTVMQNTLPDLELDELSEGEKLQCLVYGNSASERLAKCGNKFPHNELSAIHISLQLADMINQHEVDVDSTSTNICKEYMFDINKLLPIFDRYFE